GSCSQCRVEPATSVNRKVTVPFGSVLIRLPAYHPNGDIRQAYQGRRCRAQGTPPETAASCRSNTGGSGLKTAPERCGVTDEGLTLLCGLLESLAAAEGHGAFRGADSCRPSTHLQFGVMDRAFVPAVGASRVLRPLVSHRGCHGTERTSLVACRRDAM